MKKILVLVIVCMFSLPAVSFAATWTAEAIESSGELISTLSNNVTLNSLSGGDNYVAVSGHASGNKVYASSSGDTKIYSQTSDPVDVSGKMPSASDTSFADISGWEAL